MKVLVDGIFFQLATSGIARVWASILPRLIARGRVEVFILDRGRAPRCPGATLIPFPSYTDRYCADDSMLIQKICDQYKIDVFTSTYYTTPLATPMFLCVYDMIPEKFGFDLQQRFWKEKEVAILFARSFMAISKTTKADLLQFHPEIRPRDVVVAYPGVDTEVFKPQDERDVEAFRRRVGFQRPYFLMVGSREQHRGYKNGGLFFSGLKELGSDAIDVLCIGGEDEIAQECLDLVPKGVRVERLMASDGELALAYAGALALVYPSLYEGFGLPVLEAMATGCPVITTRNGSLGEIATGSCVTIDGNSVPQMTRALEVVQRAETRSRLLAEGYAKAATFSWEPMVDAVEEQCLRLLDASKAGAFASFFKEWSRLRHLQASVDIETLH